MAACTLPKHDANVAAERKRAFAGSRYANAGEI